jgi:hypothetical protein
MVPLPTTHLQSQLAMPVQQQRTIRQPHNQEPQAQPTPRHITITTITITLPIPSQHL